ncbi:hypothetical protein [Xanthomonas cucurbitae]|uniref:Uncharacterized protein n=1 Tax=Xanthomonas cucurbitae TaxID=56453 RepID=A0ABY7YD94_9XANT|nr:hypothetical protein [Xanthomonas cucurbitae]WDM67913.1 hypothetical protein K6981_00820 [Xanthomonas cucurbitae]WDM71787.1 hypothetical protein K6978_00815 [Xanthomonas cucurbitae]
MPHPDTTAAGAFEARSSETRFLMARLGFALTDKRALAAAESDNWGHADDMAHVAGLLRQAVAFLGGEEG